MSSLGAIPVLLALAVVVVELGRAAVAVRRGRRLNRAMHELRRPLQTLGLVLERDATDLEAGRACMRQARQALVELDAVVNRVRRPRRIVEGELAEVMAGLRARWRLAGVDVSSSSRRGVVLEPESLGAAIDNLIANALEHGSTPVTVGAEVDRDDEAVRLVVRDAGAVGVRPRRRRDPRRGHGLPMVEELAQRSGGRTDIAVRGDGAGTVASVTVPLRGQRDTRRFLSDGGAGSR